MAHLDMIRDEDGAAEAASYATDDVDDADTQPTEQLLHVSHEQQLKDDADHQLDNPAQHQHTQMLPWQLTLCLALGCASKSAHCELFPIHSNRTVAAVTHPGTNRVRCRVTTLIETNVLPLSQTGNTPSISPCGNHDYHHHSLDLPTEGWPG